MQPSMERFLGHSEDGRLSVLGARNSVLPTRTAVRASPTTTSMLRSGNDSLPAHTSRSTAPTVASAATPHSGYAGRLLEPGPSGALQIAPPRDQTIYQCPFHFINCGLTFVSREEWLKHSFTHFGRAQPPNKNECYFCENVSIGTNGRQSWTNHMTHLSFHFQTGHRMATARPSFKLYQYLYGQRIINEVEFRDLQGDSGSRHTNSSTPGSSTARPVPEYYSVVEGRQRNRRPR
jgi:hypothetical protein